MLSMSGRRAAIVKVPAADSANWDAAYGWGDHASAGYLSKIENWPTLSNNTSDANNDIDITAGCVPDSTFARMLSWSSGMTKRLDASWAAGTNQGGLFSGSKANSTWYHFHAIEKDSDGSIDFGFDTSVTAANKPAGYTKYRRIGSVKTDGSGNLYGFWNVGDVFGFATKQTDYSALNPGTDSVDVVLSSPPNVFANVRATVYDPTGAPQLLLRAKNETNEVPGWPSAPLFDSQQPTSTTASMSQRWLHVDSAGKIAFRLNTSAANVRVTIVTVQWEEVR